MLAVLIFVLLAGVTGNPGGFLIKGNLNVSETKIINDGNHTLSVNYDITTDYPADSYRVIINKEGSLTEEPAFKTSKYYDLVESNPPHHISSSENFKVDTSWPPSRDYLAHIQFNSTGGKVDAGLYERFEVEAFGYLNIYKFNDLNKNGKWDNGEPPLSGWKFTVHAPDNRDYDGITNSQGKAEFLNGSLPLGDYAITEISKPNWIHTGTETKTGNQLSSIHTDNYENVIASVDKYQITNVYFGNRLKDAKLTLNAFYDYNGDRSQSGPLEPGISSWTFTIYGGPENNSYKVTTNGDGIVVLNLSTSEVGAVYHIQEVLPNDRWECTTPSIEKEVVLMPGAAESVGYGNRLKPTMINITKFRDYNGNGQRESNENGLSWTFNINGADGSVDAITTDDNGRFDYKVLFPMPSPLNDLPVRSYKISEEPKNNWIMTTPPIEKAITVGPGSREAVPAFGNYLPQIILIYKFNDTNKNGIHDQGEEGVPRWQFLIEDSSGSSTINETNSSGMITIKAKPDTRYTATEYLKPNWEPTTPTQQELITDSETQEFPPLMFGNFKNITQRIIISEFEDIHNKGSRDVDEMGLGGWVFDVTGPVNTQENGTTRVTTNDGGDAVYTAPSQGLYIVKEIKKSGCWINTTNDTVPVYLPAGETVRVEFGNSQICHTTIPIALQNPDIEVRKFVDPSHLTADMVGNCGETYLNYTIQIRPKNKAEATDLVIAINNMVPRTKNSKQTIDTVVNGVAGFLDEQATESNPSSRVGLIRWIGNESNEIYPNSNYRNLSAEVKDSQFVPTNSTSIFADWTFGIIDEFYRVSLPDTKKILVLVTDSESPISRPTEVINANYTIHAIAIGGKETDTTRLLRKLTNEHHGKLYSVNDSTEMQNALTELAWVTRPTTLKNIQLTDTLPSYLKPVSYLVNPPDPKNITENNDGRDWDTTTIKWWVGNLSSSAKPWNTSFKVRFCWIVPADIHQTDTSPRVSQVNYVREDSTNAAIQVPEGAISINRSGAKVPGPTTSGFQSLIAMIGLLAAVYVMKRR
jgi:hypothetical protein